MGGGGCEGEESGNGKEPRHRRYPCCPAAAAAGRTALFPRPRRAHRHFLPRSRAGAAARRAGLGRRLPAAAGNVAGPGDGRPRAAPLCPARGRSRGGPRGAFGSGLGASPRPRGGRGALRLTAGALTAFLQPLPGAGFPLRLGPLTGRPREG